MLTRCLWLFPLLIAGWIPPAAGQDVWAYAVVGPDNQPSISFRAPIDLTYPPAGAPMPVVGPNEDASARGIRLVPQEAARRQSAARVIIMLLPAQQARNISRMPTQQSTNPGALPQPSGSIRTTPGY